MGRKARRLQRARAHLVELSHRDRSDVFGESGIPDFGGQIKNFSQGGELVG